MLKLVRKFKGSKSGVTAIEYGLIAGFISVVIIGALTASSSSMESIFTKIQNALHDAAAGGGTTG
ncbi:Flp family type IVb pilin [Dongia soli]|uniref:Flp family type IVb pilin n=1 Tax=Dongia soli TaxID=600628 RepID=A0ABU5EBB8_9PROT|nr:Flp family type IVb pilin [Dongia soli]MDY0883290.1 Flp family type IVb pilin [Dongia soli]